MTLLVSALFQTLFARSPGLVAKDRTPDRRRAVVQIICESIKVACLTVPAGVGPCAVADSLAALVVI